MEIDFWYTNIAPNTRIRESIEKIDPTNLFKNIDTDYIDQTKLNFLVFKWETRWSFPNSTHTHSIEFIELLIRLQTDNFYFISDFSGESHSKPDELSLYFLNKLKSNSINTNRLFVANNNSNNIGIHKVKYDNFILNTIFFPNFFLSTYNHLINYVVKHNHITPDKKFLCLNRRMYYHKYKIIEELFDRELLNDTRLSWVDNKHKKNLLNKKLTDHLGIDSDNFKSIQLEDDVMYGNELSKREEYLYTVNPNWYYKSKVNIITETNFNQLEIHITEKTWKAIYLGVPFVVSASRGHLKTLRDMGFKTFNSVINEDYDEMDGDHKIKHIIDSAVELSNVYNSKEVLDICKFNQDLYFNKEYRKDILNKTFLNYLYNIESQLQPTNLI